MNTEILTLLSTAWYLVGYTGFLYWARWDGDVGLGECLFGLIIAVGGPVTWLLGLIINIGDVLFSYKESK